MKYLLLIHQGTAPTPYTDDWQSLGEDEQKAIYADYQAINQTPGVTPGLQMEPPETATTVRVETGNAHHGRAVRGGEALGGFFTFEARISTPRSSWHPACRPRAWAAPWRSGRWWSGDRPRAGLPTSGAAYSPPDRVPRRLRARRGRREAFAAAAERWPRDGTPANPRAWLITTARNRAIDRIRRDRTLAEKTRLLDVPEAVEDVLDDTTIPDERLELVFTCITRRCRWRRRWR